MEAVRIIAITVFSLVAVMVLAVGLFLAGQQIRRWVAPVEGQTGAIERRESASNRIAKQEMFEQLYADIQAVQIQIETTSKTLDESGGSERDFYISVLNGQRNHCLSLVADYNAEANKFTSEQFRDVSLPYQFEQSICTEVN